MQTGKSLVIRAWLSIALLFTGHVCAASLDPALLPQVQSATFEVVVPKPDESTITYEKPLPLDQLPFQFRNDKYYSIGTAFALGEGRYVTAFHVLGSVIGGLIGPPALRDASGHVYAIDKVTRFSLQEDFIEFSLVDAPKVKPLEVDRTPPLNDVVYAVGNALGTGVVIRDGLYTSDTPEEEDGRWKWMRFSAAASPGNSGGPLLDKNGKIIGVVLMKSPSENLNYALPIGRVIDAPTVASQMDKRTNYSLSIMDDTLPGTFRGSVTLPRSYADFAAEYQRQTDAFTDEQAKALLAKHADNIFPRGADSHRLLASSPELGEYPSIIRRSSGGTWEMTRPKFGRDPLPDNGYLARGAAGQDLVLHLRKPDSVSSKDLYGDPKRFEDLLLKATPMNRDVGPEKVKVVSLGKPIGDETYVDHYRRSWRMLTFALPYSNAVLELAALPVPDGYIAVARYLPADARHPGITELKILSDFVSDSYDGSFAQWKEFLASGVALPEALRAMKLSIDYDKQFDLASPTIKLRYGTELQKIGPDGELALAFSYQLKGDTPLWQINGVVAQPDVNKHDMVRVNFHPKPFDDSDNKVKASWDKLLNREHPQDGEPYSTNDIMYVGTIAGDPAKTAAAAKPDHLYTVFYGVDGTRPAETMKEKLALSLKGLTVDGP
jgi:serine protease Do